MSSSAQTTPPDVEPVSNGMSRTPSISPAPQEALLLLTLMERYHQVAQVLKVLRQDARTRMTFPERAMNPEGLEAHRVAATGLFNHLYLLLQNGLLTPAGFSMTLSPRAAALWLEFVAPLDHVVRAEAAAREGQPGAARPLGETDVEVFYARYAQTGELMMRVRKAPDPNTH